MKARSRGGNKPPAVRSEWEARTLDKVYIHLSKLPGRKPRQKGEKWMGAMRERCSPTAIG